MPTPPPPPTPPDFSLSVSPGTVSTTVGNTSGPLTVTVNPVNGFSGSVEVAISGIPLGITSSPASPFTVAVGSPQQVTFSAPAAAGTFAVTFTATSSPGVQTAATLAVAAPPNQFIVAAVYFPWYTGNWWTPTGCYNGLTRKELLPPQTPMLGEYNSRSADVITQHIAWATGAGVNALEMEWIQPRDFNDSTLHDRILTNPHISDIRFAIFYDLALRFKLDFNLTQDKIDTVIADFQYLAQTYFSNSQYLNVEGNRPVVFLYFTSAFHPVSSLQQMGASIRAAMNHAGFNVFLIGDEYYPGYVLPDPARIGIWDGIFGFGASLNYLGYSDDNGLLAFHATSQAQFDTVAQSLGVDFIPAVTPGFNDKGVRRTCPSSPVLARRTSASALEGSLFEKWLTALTLPYAARSRTKLVHVSTWNEWHEDTSIEPSLVTAATTRDDSPSGTQFTQGFVYEGYGTRYLDILRAAIATYPAPVPGERRRP